MGKPPKVIWYVLTVWDGKTQSILVWYVCGMVPWYDVVDALYG